MIAVLSAEVRRRLVHASGAAFPLLYVAGIVAWRELQALYVAATAVALALEGFRLYGRVDWWIYRQLTRDYEEANLAGYALYAIGATAVALAFEPAIAVPAILMLSIADPVSGVLGANELRRVKRPRVLAATFGICAAIGLWFLPPVPAVLGAAAATVADGAKPRIAGYVIDDNLGMPIGAAVAAWAGLRWLPPVA